MSQCLRCPIYNREHKTCMLCECYMPIKASFAKQRCAGEIDGVSSARGWIYKESWPTIEAALASEVSGILDVRTDGRMGATRAVSSLDMLTEAAIRRGPQLKATEASGSLIFADWSDLESPITEATRSAAIARGRAAGIIINDQQKENDE